MESDQVVGGPTGDSPPRPPRRGMALAAVVVLGGLIIVGLRPSTAGVDDTTATTGARFGATVPESGDTTTTFERPRSELVTHSPADLGAGPSMSVVEIEPPAGFARVTFLSELGDGVLAAGDSGRGVAVALADDRSRWQPGRQLTGAGWVVSAAATRGEVAVVAVVRNESNLGFGLNVEDSTSLLYVTTDGGRGWDVVAPSDLGLAENLVVSVVAVGDEGASVFIARSNSQMAEVRQTLPVEIARLVDEGHSILTIEGNVLRLESHFRQVLWEAPLGELGLEGLTPFDFYGFPESSMLTTSDYVTWREVEDPFGLPTQRWQAFEPIVGPDRTGLIPFFLDIGPPRVFWTEDGVNWSPGEAVRHSGPTIFWEDRMVTVDHNWPTPSLRSERPDGSWTTDIFDLQDADIVRGAVGAGGQAWTLVSGPGLRGPSVAALPVRTISGDLRYDLNSDAFLLETESGTLRWQLPLPREAYEPDLVAGTIRLLDAQKAVLAEFELSAAVEMWQEYAGSIGVRAGSLLFSPDGERWGIRRFAGGEITAMAPIGDEWIIATGSQTEDVPLAIYVGGIEG